MVSSNYPRVVIGGPSSGVGKTTITLAIMSALNKRGLKVQGFKVGPDFIDPGHYAHVTGRPGRNLDTWMIGQENSLKSFVRAASDADISIVEGVMGLYDGRYRTGEGTTAEVAKTLKSPIIMVLNCARIATSAGAVALGFINYDEDANIKGFILNNISSDKHEAMVKKSVEETTGLPVIGAVRRDTEIHLPERHLGLITSHEHKEKNKFRRLLEYIANHYIDIDALLDIANSAPALDADAELFIKLKAPKSKSKKNVDEDIRPVIAIAYDKAFCFYYQDNLDILEEAGAKLAYFSPIEDKRLPENTAGIYLGGGYPEVHARALSNNVEMKSEIAQAINRGMPVYAECGGLMYLSDFIEDFDNMRYEMCGVLPLECSMQNKPVLGYRIVKAINDSIIANTGDVLRGHEFHYSKITIVGKRGRGKTIKRDSNIIKLAYKSMDGEKNADKGLIINNTLASYIHLHFASNPEIALKFVATCKEYLDNAWKAEVEERSEIKA